MRIEEVRITHFQCFGPAGTVIRLSENLTALVGANGSGKTAFLQALSRLFGVTSRERDIRRSDFHVSPDEEEERSERTLSIEAILAFDELDADGNGQQEQRAVPACFNEMAASENGDLKCRIRLNAVWTDDGTVDGDINVERFWIHTLEEDFTQDECSKLSSADRGHIQMVYVPAQRDAASQVTSFLRGRLWRAIDWSDDARQAVIDAGEALQNAFGGEDAVAAISRAIEKRWQEVHDGGTNATPLLQLIDARFEEVVRKVGVAFFPTEEGRQRELSELSDGQRSLFHIALTAAILDIEQSLLAVREGQKGFRTDDLPLPSLTILAIEEPENNLAPYYLSRIIRQVLDLGRHGGGWGRIKNACLKLLSNGVPQESLLALPEYEDHTMDDLNNLHKLEYDAEYMKDWITHLRAFGVYFNEPLDLDMSMFAAFRDEYKQLPPGATGPKGEADEACLAVLGSNGDPELCGDLRDDDYLWYRYLFMTKSKPATHLYALALIEDVDLLLAAPDAISELLKHVNQSITPAKAQ